MKFIVVHFEIVKRNSPHIWFISGWWFGTWMDYFSHHIGIYWECHPPNWLSVHHFSEGWLAQPPTRMLLTIINHIITILTIINSILPTNGREKTTKQILKNCRCDMVILPEVTLASGVLTELSRCDISPSVRCQFQLPCWTSVTWRFEFFWKKSERWIRKRQRQRDTALIWFDIADMVWWRWKPTGFVLIVPPKASGGEWWAEKQRGCGGGKHRGQRVSLAWFRQVSTPEKDSQVIIILLELLESKYSVTVPAPGFSML